jgi:hypothetical protein
MKLVLLKEHDKLRKMSRQLEGQNASASYKRIFNGHQLANRDYLEAELTDSTILTIGF